MATVEQVNALSVAVEGVQQSLEDLAARMRAQENLLPAFEQMENRIKAAEGSISILGQHMQSDLKPEKHFDNKSAAAVTPDAWDGKSPFREFANKVENWISAFHPRGQA